MTIKEILSEITDYIILSPIANNHYRKSRQWLYHKINEDVINNVQYKLSDGEIDILISALDDIKDNIHTVIQNLEEFKVKREYLKIPEDDRKLLESYQQQLKEIRDKDGDFANYNSEDEEELIRHIYASTTNQYILEYADGLVERNSWYLRNLKNESIKYEGKYIEKIVTEVIYDIDEKMQEREKKSKKKDDFDNDSIYMFELPNIINAIAYKIYYHLNNLTPSESLQRKIDKLPKSIAFLGNIEVSEIEKIVYEKIDTDTNTTNRQLIE